VFTERAKRVTFRGEEGSSNDGSKRDEEEWPLKEVVFLEDVKSVPLGRVLKVDGAYAAVRFPIFGKDGKVTLTRPRYLFIIPSKYLKYSIFFRFRHSETKFIIVFTGATSIKS
jgi:hypothetical protein